eukprot:scaffold62627_cov34-Phaeocystis_antarctica.AAC.3
MAVYHPLARQRHPASHGLAGLSALANGAPACPPWWPIARAAWVGEPAANRPPRSAVGGLTDRNRCPRRCLRTRGEWMDERPCAA